MCVCFEASQDRVSVSGELSWGGWVGEERLRTERGGGGRTKGGWMTACAERTSLTLVVMTSQMEGFLYMIDAGSEVMDVLHSPLVHIPSLHSSLTSSLSINP